MAQIVKKCAKDKDLRVPNLPVGPTRQDSARASCPAALCGRLIPTSTRATLLTVLTQAVAHADKSSGMSETERRGTERLLLTVPIRVMAFGPGNSAFTEDTCAVEVNRDGARITLKHRVAPNDILRIINLENYSEADFRVVGSTRLAGEGVAEWGVECLDQGRSIWGIDFPRPLAPQDSQSAALLACAGCGKQVLCVLSLVEIDILNSTGTIQRLCEQCGEFSSWMYADMTRRPQSNPASASAVRSPPPAQKWDGHTDRRAHRRLALKLPVLVRNSKGEQEIAKTENISKGGLAACLGMKLAVGEIVWVVCPYTEGGQHLEQRAEVRRRISFMEGERWIYGFRYVQ